MGEGNKIEIWDKERWEEEFRKSQESFDQISDTLTGLGPCRRRNDKWRCDGTSTHPCFSEEVISLLGCGPHRIYVDATLGGGGHALEILKRTEPDGRRDRNRMG